MVDDDADIRNALRICLESESYRVDVCTDGRDAIDRLEGGLQPDALLLDLMMPRMNGLEVLAALKENPLWAAIPVVVISANRGYSAEDLGAALVLRKPFDLRDLMAALDKVAGTTLADGTTPPQ